MIRVYLESLLRERFPEVAFIFHQELDPFATLDPPCAALGRLEICDDGDEATVFLSEITHGHFGCYDDNASGEERERKIAADVVHFLEQLFSDRVVIYQMLGGQVSGWSMLAPAEALPARSVFRKQYLWSGAISDASPE